MSKITKMFPFFDKNKKKEDDKFDEIGLFMPDELDQPASSLNMQKSSSFQPQIRENNQSNNENIGNITKTKSSAIIKEKEEALNQKKNQEEKKEKKNLFSDLFHKSDEPKKDEKKEEKKAEVISSKIDIFGGVKHSLDKNEKKEEHKNEGNMHKKIGLFDNINQNNENKTNDTKKEIIQKKDENLKVEKPKGANMMDLMNIFNTNKDTQNRKIKIIMKKILQ